MTYQSDVETMEDLIASFKTKSMVWQVDFVALLRQFQSMVRPEHLPTINNLLAMMEEHGEQCELRGETILQINSALKDIVLCAVDISCSTKPGLIDRFEPGLVWTLDEDACKVCGLKIDNGDLDDSGWYCTVDFILDDIGVDPAPHEFGSFSIRMDSDTRDYLDYKPDVSCFKDMLYEASMFGWFERQLTIQQLQDISAWCNVLRAAAFLRV